MILEAFTGCSEASTGTCGSQPVRRRVGWQNTFLVHHHPRLPGRMYTWRILTRPLHTPGSVVPWPPSSSTIPLPGYGIWAIPGGISCHLRKRCLVTLEGCHSEMGQSFIRSARACELLKLQCKAELATNALPLDSLLWDNSSYILPRGPFQRWDHVKGYASGDGMPI